MGYGRQPTRGLGAPDLDWARRMEERRLEEEERRRRRADAGVVNDQLAADQGARRAAEEAQAAADRAAGMISGRPNGYANVDGKMQGIRFGAPGRVNIGGRDYGIPKAGAPGSLPTLRIDQAELESEIRKQMGLEPSQRTLGPAPNLGPSYNSGAFQEDPRTADRAAVDAERRKLAAADQWQKKNASPVVKPSATGRTGAGDMLFESLKADPALIQERMEKELARAAGLPVEAIRGLDKRDVGGIIRDARKPGEDGLNYTDRKALDGLYSQKAAAERALAEHESRGAAEMAKPGSAYSAAMHRAERERLQGLIQQAEERIQGFGVGTQTGTDGQGPAQTGTDPFEALLDPVEPPVEGEPAGFGAATRPTASPTPTPQPTNPFGISAGPPMEKARALAGQAVEMPDWWNRGGAGIAGAAVPKPAAGAAALQTQIAASAPAADWRQAGAGAIVQPGQADPRSLVDQAGWDTAMNAEDYQQFSRLDRRTAAQKLLERLLSMKPGREMEDWRRAGAGAIAG